MWNLFVTLGKLFWLLNENQARKEQTMNKVEQEQIQKNEWVNGYGYS